MTLIIVLNAFFAAFVLAGVVGLHLYAIAKDRAEHAQSSLVRATTDGSAVTQVPHRRAGRGRVARGEIGAVSVQRRAASGRALPLSS